SAPNFACSSIRKPVSVSPALHGFDAPFLALISTTLLPNLKAFAFDLRSTLCTACVALSTTCPLTRISIELSGVLYGRSDARRRIGTPGRKNVFLNETVCGPARHFLAHRYTGAPQ